MTNLWWLEPSWKQAVCHCGVNIWDSGGDPDHGVCFQCFEAQYREQEASEEADREMENEMSETRAPISDDELAQWAERRADDAGHLARELVPLRKAEAAMRDALETISNMHGTNPSLAYADVPREDYLAHVLYEARQLARAALSKEG